MAGGRSVFVRGNEKNSFKIGADEIESAITDATKAIILNTPSNPTGIAYSEDELRAIAEVAVRKDLLIISDEIYEKIIFDDYS